MTGFQTLEAVLEISKLECSEMPLRRGSSPAHSDTSSLLASADATEDPSNPAHPSTPERNPSDPPEVVSRRSSITEVDEEVDGLTNSSPGSGDVNQNKKCFEELAASCNCTHKVPVITKQILNISLEDFYATFVEDNAPHSWLK